MKPVVSQAALWFGIRHVSCILTRSVQAFCGPQSCPPTPGVEAELRGERRGYRKEGPPKPQSPASFLPLLRSHLDVMASLTPPSWLKGNKHRTTILWGKQNQ